MEPVAEKLSSPTTRTIGVIYLLYFLAAFLAAFLTKGLVVPGNAAATSNGTFVWPPLASAMSSYILPLGALAELLLMLWLLVRAPRT